MANIRSKAGKFIKPLKKARDNHPPETKIPENNPGEIKIDNLLTIEQSQKLRQKLLEMLESDRIRITAELCESIDLTAIQLFQSLFKTISADNKKIFIEIKLSEDQKSLLENTGIYNKIFTK